jgi:hypothetical protein
MCSFVKVEAFQKLPLSELGFLIWKGDGYQTIQKLTKDCVLFG